MRVKPKGISRSKEISGPFHLIKLALLLLLLLSFTQAFNYYEELKWKGQQSIFDFHYNTINQVSICSNKNIIFVKKK